MRYVYLVILLVLFKICEYQSHPTHKRECRGPQCQHPSHRNHRNHHHNPHKEYPHHQNHRQHHHHQHKHHINPHRSINNNPSHNPRHNNHRFANHDSSSNLHIKKLVLPTEEDSSNHLERRSNRSVNLTKNFIESAPVEVAPVIAREPSSINSENFVSKEEGINIIKLVDYIKGQSGKSKDPVRHKLVKDDLVNSIAIQLRLDKTKPLPKEIVIQLKDGQNPRHEFYYGRNDHSYHNYYNNHKY